MAELTQTLSIEDIERLSAKLTLIDNLTTFANRLHLEDGGADLNSTSELLLDSLVKLIEDFDTDVRNLLPDPPIEQS